MKDDINDQIEAAFTGKVEKIELTGRKLRTDRLVGDPMMDDRELVLRCVRDYMYRDMLVALTTTVWGREIGTHTYHVPERTTDYLLIWLRDVLEARRWTRWIAARIPKPRMRKVGVDVREEFPEFHPTQRFGKPCIALYMRGEP